MVRCLQELAELNDIEKDFIINQVSWTTQRIRNYDPTEENNKTYLYFKTLINFLQENGLTTHIILPTEESVKEETCIRRSDLTEDGYEFF